MAAQLPRVPYRKVERALGRNGFVLVRQSGSHARWRHPDGRATTVPRHSGGVLPLGTLKVILDDTGLSPEDMR